MHFRVRKRTPHQFPSAETHSGRVRGRKDAHSKAEIALDNIPTRLEHGWRPADAAFAILCAATTTTTPSQTNPHSDLTSYIWGVVTISGKCRATNGPKFFVVLLTFQHSEKCVSALGNRSEARSSTRKLAPKIEYRRFHKRSLPQVPCLGD